MPTPTAIFAALCALLALWLILALRRVTALKRAVDAELSRQRSLSTTYGRITEQWFPLMDAYPYDAQNFRFLGSPVDGVQFEEDRIVFVEFKTNRSQLSAGQRRLKRLVEEGRVTWEEFRFDDAAAAKDAR